MPQPPDGLPNGLVGQPPRGDPRLEAHVGQQVLGPGGPGLAELPLGLVQDAPGEPTIGGSVTLEVADALLMLDSPRAVQLLKAMAPGPPELRATRRAVAILEDKERLELQQKMLEEFERAGKEGR